MRLETIVKVRADSPEEAIEKVIDLLTDDWEYVEHEDFAQVREEDTRISEVVKTERDFRKLRELEEKEAERLMAKAKNPRNPRRGFDLILAGEALSSGIFWSTRRLAYVLKGERGAKAYFVETVREY